MRNSGNDRRRWTAISFKTGLTTLLTASRGLDNDGRVWSVGYTAGGIMQQTFTYSYDRDTVTKMVREQGSGANESAWVYAYDAQGQLLSADNRYSSAGVPSATHLAGYQTDYTYDRMGNRLTKKEGGTATGGNGMRTTNYTPNALNQYTSLTNPQAVDVTGNRAAGQTIAVAVSPGTSSSVLYQANATTGLQFSSVVTNAHSGAGVGEYSALTVTTASPLTTLDSGNLYLPPASETPVYDADGNLLQDGRWAYQYDGQNRLMLMTTRHTVSVAFPGTRLSFGYDGLSRRAWKKVERSTATNTWTWISTEAFLYDGWNLVMKVNYSSAGAPISRQSYVWGADIASTPDGHESMQSAGGVGGLLMVLDQRKACPLVRNSHQSLNHETLSDWHVHLLRRGCLPGCQYRAPLPAHAVPVDCRQSLPRRH